MPSADKLARHDTTDRVLQAVCAGASTLGELQDRLNVGKAAAQRSAVILVREGLLIKHGERHHTTFKPTDAGRKGSSWLRSGGTRTSQLR